MKAPTNRLFGMVVEVLRCVDLLQDAPRQHGDPVAHRHRLDLVVGHVDGGDVQRVLDLGDLGAHLHAQLGVEVRQRLVHQERLRLAHDRPAHRHPLALAARQLTGSPIEVLGELEDPGRLLDALVDLGLGHLLQLEREGDVVAHREVRVQRVRLEHHRDVAVLGLEVVDDLVADAQLTRRDRLQPGDHPQRGRLATARRADEHEELAVGHVERELVHGVEPVLVHLVDLLERDAAHCGPLLLDGR